MMMLIASPGDTLIASLIGAATPPVGAARMRKATARLTNIGGIVKAAVDCAGTVPSGARSAA